MSELKIRLEKRIIDVTKLNFTSLYFTFIL
jgi:hypothetical protein